MQKNRHVAPQSRKLIIPYIIKKNKNTRIKWSIACGLEKESKSVMASKNEENDLNLNGHE